MTVEDPHSPEGLVRSWRDDLPALESNDMQAAWITMAAELADALGAADPLGTARAAFRNAATGRAATATNALAFAAEVRRMA